MKRLSFLIPHRRVVLGVAVTAAIYAASLLYLPAADPNSADTSAKTEKPAPKKAEKKKFSGADLYAMHCNRCHPERYATERTPAQWKTILLHMRVRANLPAEQARSIMKYLQEDSGKP